MLRKKHSYLIKYFKSLTEPEVLKALDKLLESKLIGKREYKSILKECQKD